MLGINGGLTSINISGNHLCGNYLNEIIPRDITGIKELARALGVNGALTKIELSSSFIGEEGKALIRGALQGKAGFELLF